MSWRFKQSLMEVGATICNVSKPNFSSCHVSSQSRAFSLSQENKIIFVTFYPTKVVKANPRCDFCCVCVLEILNQESNRYGGSFVFVKRHENGLVASLLEFSYVIMDEKADLATKRNTINLCFLFCYKMSYFLRAFFLY